MQAVTNVDGLIGRQELTSRSQAPALKVMIGVIDMVRQPGDVTMQFETSSNSSHEAQVYGKARLDQMKH